MGGNKNNRRAAVIIVALAFILCVTPGSAHAQNGTLKLNLKTAAGASELPAGPWGCYSTSHAGPCYLASRSLAPLFSFPIIVGQQRDELLPIGSRTAAGKMRLRPERITLLRRAVGLSPVSALRNASGQAPVARIVDADADNLLTTASITFPAAPLAQEVSPHRDAQGLPIPAENWGAAIATVSWSPAFADNATEGLVVRITLTNTGTAPQTFFVDMLGGLDRPDPLFSSADISATPDPDGHGVTFKHSKFNTWFALAARSGDYVNRSFAVSNAIFAEISNSGLRDPAGGVSPPTETSELKSWALTRVSGITVGPGEIRTVALCVGLGTDADGAMSSAQTLLSLTEDGKPGAGTENLFKLAARAHENSGYHAGAVAIERLMAQSLTNVPFHDMRRVGVPSRIGPASYMPGLGGWMALGWSGYRTDWAAAQLNAWFLTGTTPQKAINHVIAVPPIDILALWELEQRTHDRDMLAKFYPYAVWRFREFLESGREREDDWLFTWPMPKDKPVTQNYHGIGGKQAASLMWESPFGFVPSHPSTSTCIASIDGTSAPSTDAAYAPEYSAYVILSARILLACAKILEKSAEEQASFSHVIEHASQAMSKELWDAKRGLFVAKLVSTTDAVTVMARREMVEANGLECLLPLIVGPEILSAEQDAALRKHLQDSSTFLSPFGLRSLSMKSETYRADDAERGAVRFGAQWLFWKALLDRGDATNAAGLATRVISAYDAAVDSGGGYPEWLRADTGSGCGRLDSTGDACALISLYESYHRTGTVSSGWDTNLLDHHYDSATDSQRVVYRALVREPKGVLLCVMGKPGGVYHASGGITGNFTADANGALTLPMPNDHTTQQVEISPAGSLK